MIEIVCIAKLSLMHCFVATGTALQLDTHQRVQSAVHARMHAIRTGALRASLGALWFDCCCCCCCCCLCCCRRHRRSTTLTPSPQIGGGGAQEVLARVDLKLSRGVRALLLMSTGAVAKMWRMKMVGMQILRVMTLALNLR